MWGFLFCSKSEIFLIDIFKTLLFVTRGYFSCCVEKGEMLLQFVSVKECSPPMGSVRGDCGTADLYKVSGIMIAA